MYLLNPDICVFWIRNNYRLLLLAKLYQWGQNLPSHLVSVCQGGCNKVQETERLKQQKFTVSVLEARCLRSQFLLSSGCVSVSVPCFSLSVIEKLSLSDLLLHKWWSLHLTRRNLIRFLLKTNTLLLKTEIISLHFWC